MKERGTFGRFGGYYVSEILLPRIEEVEAGFLAVRDEPEFWQSYRTLLETWAGRPTPLYPSPALSEAMGCRVYLKREDLLHGGAHKTNNAVGQALLAKRMGKSRLLAETGAGQHGVATAMVAARLGLEATIYMGAKDVERQAPNVERMRLFGADLRPVSSGGAGLEDAINEAMKDWCERSRDTFYLFGTAAGPHPFPTMVKAFQRVIGDEIRAQLGRNPDAVIACVGGGSNAIGAFCPFIDDEEVALYGAEPGGTPGVGHGAALTLGSLGSLHGALTAILQDEEGQIQRTHSVSAGLDYPGVGPEHAHLADTGRARYEPVSDAEALKAFRWLALHEGILGALESTHAVALGLRWAGRFPPEAHVVINLSGRGDKDLGHAARELARLDAQNEEPS